MNTYVSSQSNNNKQVWYNGKLVNAQKVNNHWVAYIDGKCVRLDDAILSFSNKATECPQHFVSYYDSQYKKYAEQRKELKAKSKTLSDMIKDLSEKYSSLLAKYNAKKFSDLVGAQKNEAFELLSETFGLKKQRNRIDMAFMSACMSGFDAALKKGSWGNMLALAKAIIK
ncbi:hypothetical protein IKQ21_02980 [bacterium]|nr:hypothetical protein [bacterium]